MQGIWRGQRVSISILVPPLLLVQCERLDVGERGVDFCFLYDETAIVCMSSKFTFNVAILSCRCFHIVFMSSCLHSKLSCAARWHCSLIAGLLDVVATNNKPPLVTLYKTSIGHCPITTRFQHGINGSRYVRKIGWSVVGER